MYHKSKLVRFDSPLQFLSPVLKNGGTWKTDSMGGKFYGPTSPEALDNYLKQGDRRYVSEAEALVKELESYVDFVAIKRKWTNDVVGVSPNVANYLAGSPFTMRRRAKVHDERAPIKIYTCISCSAAIPVSLLVQRGKALLALAMILSSVRPTEMWVFACMNSTVNPAVKLPMLPPDFGVICTCLADPAFDRGAMHQYGYQHGDFDGMWLNDGAGSLESVKTLFPNEPDAIIFPPIHYNEMKEFQDPKKWVQDKLSMILNLNKE